MKQDLQNLLEKEVDRKDFLKHVAAGVVALTGFATLAKTLGDMGAPKRTQGFGAGVYGGNATKQLKEQ